MASVKKPDFLQVLEAAHIWRTRGLGWQHMAPPTDITLQSWGGLGVEVRAGLGKVGIFKNSWPLYH